MGIMSNKVSRRVALSSIAGGLASTAAVLSVLKGRYKTNMPQRASGTDPNYNKGWNKYLKMVNVPIIELDDLSTATLDLRPQVGQKQRVVSLRSTYWKRSSPAVYPQPPIWYEVCEGQVAAVPPIQDTTTAISISVKKAFEWKRAYGHDDRYRDKPIDECVIVPSSDGIDYFEVNNGVYKRLPASKMNTNCVLIGRAIVFNYPHNTPITKGTKWVLPGASFYGVDLPCEVVGFARVAGKRTAKIVGEKHLDNQEIERCCRHGCAAYTVRIESQPSPLSLAAKQKIEKDAFSGQQNKVLQIISYVDVETGVTLRQESRLTDYQVDAEHAGQASIFITQVLG